jgi:predicted HTH domain antitoxin
MSSLAIELDQVVIDLLNESNQPAPQVAKELIVLELYRQGRLSSGKSAELLGMSRYDFIRHASELGIPFFRMTEEEWEAESAASERLAERMIKGTA